ELGAVERARPVQLEHELAGLDHVEILAGDASELAIDALVRGWIGVVAAQRVDLGREQADDLAQRRVALYQRVSLGPHAGQILGPELLVAGEEGQRGRDEGSEQDAVEPGHSLRLASYVRGSARQKNRAARPLGSRAGARWCHARRAGARSRL